MEEEAVKRQIRPWRVQTWSSTEAVNGCLNKIQKNTFVSLCLSVGAKKEGAAGFFKGIGKGLVGVVARPTGGIVDMASSTFQGIQRYSTSFSPHLYFLRQFLCDFVYSYSVSSVLLIEELPVLSVCFTTFVVSSVLLVCSLIFTFSAFVFCLLSVLPGVLFFLFCVILVCEYFTWNMLKLSSFNHCSSEITTAKVKLLFFSCGSGISFSTVSWLWYLTPVISWLSRWSSEMEELSFNEQHSVRLHVVVVVQQTNGKTLHRVTDKNFIHRVLSSFMLVTSSIILTLLPVPPLCKPRPQLVAPSWVERPRPWGESAVQGGGRGVSGDGRSRRLKVWIPGMTLGLKQTFSTWEPSYWSLSWLFFCWNVGLRRIQVLPGSQVSSSCSL